MISEEIEQELVNRLEVLQEALQCQLMAVNESINTINEIQYLLCLRKKLNSIVDKK